MSRYDYPEVGEWIRPKPIGYKLACCDCGLVHGFDFAVVNGHVEFRVWPANRETGQVRRHMSRNTDALFAKVAAIRDAIPSTEMTARAVIGEVLSIIEKED